MRAGRRRARARAAGSPGTRSCSIPRSPTRSAALGATRAASAHRVDYDFAERRIDLELEDGATVPALVGRARRSGTAAIAEAGLEVEALLRLVRPPAVRRRRAASSSTSLATAVSDALYDRIARIYDPWSVSVTEDVEFYVEEALASGGPVVELAVGTGRIARPDREGRASA